ncbi:MAG: YCF48-related protein, partial [Bacteroidia bacterium]|nr:YCF48-related protein [Bacteroidia bacterium]
TQSELKCIHFINEQSGWAVGENGTILHTTDGGNTWKELSINIPVTLTTVFFVSEKKGWVAGQKGTILYTNDEGNSWKPQSSNTENFLYSLHFINEQKGWASGEGGTILNYYCEPTVAVSHLDSEKKEIIIYPNPSTSTLHLSNLKPGSFLTLKDLLGKTIFPFQQITDNTLNLDISSINPGWYFLQINTGSKIQQFKIRKE